MCRDDEHPSWRNATAAAARLALLVMLLTSLALLSGSSAVRADEPDQGSETKIEIKITGTISPAQKAQIDELLEAFDQQNPHLKIKTKTQEKEDDDDDDESKAGKYLFFPLTAAMLATVTASTVLAHGWRRSRYAITLISNVATGIAFALVAALSLLLIFDVELEGSGLDIKFWHVVAGIVLVYLVVFHLVNNWRAWSGYARRVAKLLRPTQS